MPNLIKLGKSLLLVALFVGSFIAVAQLPANPDPGNRLERLAQADQLWLAGDRQAAEQIYRAVKGAPVSTASQPPAFSDPSQLSVAGTVLWRLAQQGQQLQLESAELVPLQMLTSEQPGFIPGQLRYAAALQAYEKPEEAIKALQAAVALYPDQAELLQALVSAHAAQEQWLEAALAARQFAMLQPEHPQAASFQQLADQYFGNYQAALRQQITGNTIANLITGILGYVITGSLFGPLTAIDSTALLLQGEGAIGTTLATQAQDQLPLIISSPLVDYIRSVGNKIAQTSGRTDLKYEFFLVRDDRLNAFALPGGKIFINAGAILKTNSEAELAGLIAHEVAHAALSHGFQLITQGNLLANLTQFLPLGDLATSLVVLNYSRSMEEQADLVGTRLLATAGYAADGLYNLMQALAKERGPRSFLAWLAPHPDTNDRLNYINQMIDRDRYNRYAYEGVTLHAQMQTLVTEEFAQKPPKSRGNS